MKEKIKEVFKNGRGIIFALFIIELVLVLFVTPNKFDDKVFLESVTNTSIGSYVFPRYYTWTSRTLIEYTLCFVLKTSKYLWILIQGLMMALAGYSISKLFIKEENKNNTIILLFLILLYPMNVMASAGWAATTVNYMWPLAACLYALIPIRKVWDGERIKPWQYPLYILAMIFACNQEQTCAILLGSYLIFTIASIVKNKKVHPMMLIQLIIAISSIVFILTCPGNYARNESEVIDNFKDMQTLTMLDKIGLGFTSMTGSIFSKGDLPFLMMTFVLFTFVCLNYKETLYRVVAGIPFAAILISFYGYNIFSRFFPFITSFFEKLKVKGVLLTAANCNNLFNVLPIAFSFIIFVCLVLTIALLSKELKKNIALLVFLAGYSSRLIMGFSPTVFASSERTMIFLDFAMIIVTLLTLQEMKKKTEKNDIKVTSKIEDIIKISGALQYINVLMCILLTQK